MKTGIELIADERKRQVEEEGYSIDHDRVLKNHQLTYAAIVYAIYDFDRSIIEYWPWVMKYLKPKSNLENLILAGALIAAEIDRIQNETYQSSHTE